MTFNKLATALTGIALAVSMNTFASVAVTADNFTRAETNMQFARYASVGGFGQFFHMRQPTQMDQQRTIRMNLDTLYSAAVFDLDAGPVTIEMPELGSRFQSAQVVSEDHYTYTSRGAGDIVLSKDKSGTRYAMVILRTFVDANSPEDIKLANAAQDKVGIKQAGTGKLELPDWDKKSYQEVFNNILALSKTIPDYQGAFGEKAEVDPVRHLLATASGWGGNPEYAATYKSFFPAQNDGKTPYTLTLKDVPVDGFWSVTVYNKDGFMQKNEYNAYALNNVTADQNKDDSYTIHFGGDSEAPNYLPIMEDWNYLVRLYEPRQEVLDGSYKIPEPLEVK